MPFPLYRLRGNSPGRRPGALLHCRGEDMRPDCQFGFSLFSLRTFRHPSSPVAMPDGQAARKQVWCAVSVAPRSAFASTQECNILRGRRSNSVSNGGSGLIRSQLNQRSQHHRRHGGARALSGRPDDPPGMVYAGRGRRPLLAAEIQSGVSF